RWPRDWSSDVCSSDLVHDQIVAGAPVETGPQSHVELLLNPGSFLRIGENSTVVLDSVELSKIAVRIVQGAVLIEAGDIDKQIPKIGRASCRERVESAV